MSEFQYDFNVNEKAIRKAIKNHECYDSWGEVQYGNDKQGVDYNICIDNTTEETEYCSAFYKIYADENGIWHHDDCCTCYLYNIDFKDKDWKKKLEEVTKIAYAELWQ